MPLAKHVDQKY